MKWENTSLRIEATISESYSHCLAMAPKEITKAVLLGTLLAKGEILNSFYGKENLPELTKSKWGTKIAFPSSLGKNLPTKGRSMALLD